MPENFGNLDFYPPPYHFNSDFKNLEFLRGKESTTSSVPPTSSTELLLTI